MRGWSKVKHQGGTRKTCGRTEENPEQIVGSWMPEYTDVEEE